MTDVPMRFPNTDLLWTVPDVYTPDECAAFVARIEAEDPQLATHNPLYRDQDRVIFDDPHTAASTKHTTAIPHCTEMSQLASGLG